MKNKMRLQGQGVCQSRIQLCIHSSLVCNGVNNCVEGDYSDEQHCSFSLFPLNPLILGYSREIIAASAIVLVSLLLTLSASAAQIFSHPLLWFRELSKINNFHIFSLFSSILLSSTVFSFVFSYCFSTRMRWTVTHL